MILNTDALSAFVDGDQTLLRILSGEPELALPTIVFGEYLYGVHQSRYGASYETWIKTNLTFFDLDAQRPFSAGARAQGPRLVNQRGQSSQAAPLDVQ